MSSSASKLSKERLRKVSKKYARKQIEKEFHGTRLNFEAAEKMPQFSLAELTLGAVLGRGGFSLVKEVRGFNLKEEVTLWKPKKGEEDPRVDHENRAFIAKHCIRGSGSARYAIKFLRKDTIDDPAKFINGIVAQGVETRFLCALDHPNIIKLRAVANVDWVDEEYFLLLDRLYDTLLERIEKWHTQRKRYTKGLLGRLTDRKGSKADALLEERLLAAFDICCALEYLHSKNVLYRDLKPENIGYDVRGVIKLFDFGISKELHPDQRLPDGTFQLTKMTGSIVYMAPEIGLGQTYNESADVYSMSILIYEILALRAAFPASFDLQAYKEQVHVGQKRPLLENVGLSTEVKQMLTKGWHQDLHERPTMSKLAQSLEDEYVRVHGYCDSERSGRSTGSEFFRAKG